jgi:hypothetical protein
VATAITLTGSDPNGDPLSYTFGGQHDVQELSDGTITVHDNPMRVFIEPSPRRGAVRG